MTSRAHAGHCCLRRPRSERETDAGRAAACGRFAPLDTRAEFLTFPEYTTAIGAEIGRRCKASATTNPTRCSCSTSPTASSSARASRSGSRPATMVVCDRYLASSIAYGEAQGVDRGVAARDPAPPAAAVADDASRHPAGGVAEAQEGGARQVRARHAAAWPRARQLPAAGGRRRTGCGSTGEQDKDAVTRRSSARFGHDSGCCKRPHFRDSASRSTRAHASSVAPVVAHIVDQHDDRGDRWARSADGPLASRRGVERERLSYVAVALSRGKRDLWRRGPRRG